MDNEKLHKTLEIYQELAKKDKSIDLAALMQHALEKPEESNISAKEKRWAYLISVAVPPLGFIFAAKFYLSGKDDGMSAAVACAVLTTFSLILTVVIFQTLLSGTGVDTSQIQQLRPQDINSLIE